jgi:hypothetical protein
MTATSWWEVVPGRTEGATPLVRRCVRNLGWSEDFSLWVLRAYKDFVMCKTFVEDYDGMKLLPSIPVDQMWCQHIIDTKNYAKDCAILVGRLLYYNADGARDADQDDTVAQRIQFTKGVLCLITNVIELNPEMWNYGNTDAPHKSSTIDNSHSSSNNNINGKRNNHNSDLYDRKGRILNDENRDVLQNSRKPKRTVLVGIQSDSGRVLYFKQKMSSDLSKCFRGYARRISFKPNYLRFSFNGEIIGPDQTPCMLNMKDGDTIYVGLEHCGC